MSADTATPTPAPAATVEVPVKSSWKSKEAWLFFASGFLWVGSEALALIPPATLAAVAWLPIVVKAVGGMSAVVGLYLRLSRPDLVTGVPWLDRSNQAALVKRGDVREPLT